MDGFFKEWTVVFPGKFGLSWKRFQLFSGTRQEATEVARETCNTVPVPLIFYTKYKEYERRTIVAEQKLADLGVLVSYDADGTPSFVEQRGKPMAGETNDSA